MPQWLRDELYKAEMHGDRVLLVMHVPPDNVECTQPWTFNYLRIVERFKHVIGAQFAGHTHRDEFRVMYSPDDDLLPIGVQFVAPSITPYSNTNPAYRVYAINNRGDLVDHETWFANLTEVELRGIPNWTKSYDAVEQFELRNLEAEELANYYHAISSDLVKFQRYFRVYTVHSDYAAVRDCDEHCRESILFAHKVSNPYNQQIPFPSTR